MCFPIGNPLLPPTIDIMQARLHDIARPSLFGTCILSPSPHFVQVAAACDLDFVFLDTEHVPIDRETISWMCRAYSAANISPIVRSPSVLDASGGATCVLDGGAAGVIAPYIETVEQVMTLVGQVKLRPLKGSLMEACKEKLRQVTSEIAAKEPSARTTSYNDPLQYLSDIVPEGTLEYMRTFNGGKMLFINIESREAIKNLDSLLSVPGVDGVFIGPHDLSCQLGVPEQWESETFLSACDDIISRCSKRGLAVGNHYSFQHAVEYQKRWRALGANLCIHSADRQFFQDGLAADLQELRGSSSSGSKNIDNV